MLAQAEQLRAGSARRQTSGFFGRFIFSLASLALLVIVFGGGLLALSGRAVPGDALYGAKRFTEGARLSLAADPTRQHELEDQFHARRIDEIWTLFAAGRQEWVDFGGPIESFADDLWLIGGVPVRLIESTVLEGVPQIGIYAWVEGDTGAGEVIASLISVRGVASPTPEPTPPQVTPLRPPDQPAPSATPSPTASLTPTPTGTPSATATSSYMPAATPSATWESLSTATWPANENGGDDNSNDNEPEDNVNDNQPDGNSNDNEPEDNLNLNDNEPEDNLNDNEPEDNVNDNEPEDNENSNSG
jgi:hypothetical protein